MSVIEIKDHVFIQTATGAYMVNKREMKVQFIEPELYTLMTGITLLSEAVKELA